MNVRTTSALRELNTVTALIGRSDASSSVMGVACALAAAVIMVLEWNQSKVGGRWLSYALANAQRQLMTPVLSLLTNDLRN